ncbi:MAG TPA: hypothetical protein VLD60_07560 [Nitrospira sp.]|nr:hypothetical protein [Nitrospira sp.]
MTRIAYRVLTSMVLAGLLLIDPHLGLSRAAEIDLLERNALVEQCAERIEKWFSLITIQARELDLQHIKYIRRGDSLVVIPLKTPHGSVTGIRWRSKEQTETLDLVRLLQQGKIGAVNVQPLLHDPAAMYEERGNLLVEVKGCQQKEQVQKVLGQCTVCDVWEWLDIKP